MQKDSRYDDMITDPDNHFLAHFLGPKAENEQVLSQLLNRVLLDYSHWRRNYFPQDPDLIPHSVRLEFQSQTELIFHEVNKMLAGLRQSFPFYSPRYIAHQQSETTMASLIGTLAGTLYNSNNVTPESGAVTVDWEIDACNSLLRMVGFRCPPDPPKSPDENEPYKRKLQTEFAWCHLTSGGTVANIEALWVARAVCYLPLAIRDACKKESLDVCVKTPNDMEHSIRDLVPMTLLRVKSNESIYLLGKFVAEIKKKKGCSVEDASKWAWEWLDKSPYSPGKGVGQAFADYPPVLLVSGSAHYSVAKAADILGIGKDNVRLIDMDDKFRLKTDHLKSELLQIRKEEKVPVAVIAIAGSTEEGAVDPIHKILDIRREFEESQNESFWLHVDAAWGGFIRSLFVDNPDSVKGEVSKDLLIRWVKGKTKALISMKVKMPFEGNISEWTASLLNTLASAQHSTTDSSALSPPADSNVATEKQIEKRTKYHLEELKKLLDSKDYEKYLIRLKTAVLDYGDSVIATYLKGLPYSVDIFDRINAIRDYVSRDIDLSLGKYVKNMNVRWPTDEVGLAFFAMEKADSITIDPHKMGYTVYPCGAIAFKNDRVRHFITQKAPYITTNRPDHLAHLPPRHATDLPTDFERGRVSTYAFAPFTLEGSRPSSSTCSLWLSSKTMPFDREHHGAVVRSSLLAARELYEWLIHWGKMTTSAGEDTYYEFLSYTGFSPDTNIVIFSAKKKVSTSIEKFNNLNTAIYDNYSIQTEKGERKNSYSQPFFLSRTHFSEPTYPYKSVESFLRRCGFQHALNSYKDHGLVVLRATVMNPYIMPLQISGRQNIIEEFIHEIHKVAAKEAARN